MQRGAERALQSTIPPAPLQASALLTVLMCCTASRLPPLRLGNSAVSNPAWLPSSCRQAGRRAGGQAGRQAAGGQEQTRLRNRYTVRLLCRFRFIVQQQTSGQAAGLRQRLATAAPPTLKMIVLAKTLLRGMSSICGKQGGGRARRAVVGGEQWMGGQCRQLQGTSASCMLSCWPLQDQNAPSSQTRSNRASRCLHSHQCMHPPLRWGG